VKAVHSGAELNVVAVEVEHLGATEDGVVLKAVSSDCWGVVGNHKQLAAALSEGLLGALEANLVLA